MSDVKKCPDCDRAIEDHEYELCIGCYQKDLEKGGESGVLNEEWKAKLQVYKNRLDNICR
jgi:hypothetical protein